MMDWYASFCSLQFMRPTKWEDPHHIDGAAGVLHMAMSLCSTRPLQCWRSDDTLISWICTNAPVNVANCQRQVRHRKRTSAKCQLVGAAGEGPAVPI